MSESLQGWSNLDPVKLNYYEICKLIAEHDVLFDSFKTNQTYTHILEHVDYDLGKEYLDIIIRYPTELLGKIIQHVELIKSNDLYGGPIKFNYPIFGDVSPTTLRYTKVLMDILSQGFNLENKDVVEIGGGYGGQCLILSKFFNFKSYTILDLETTNLLQKKYLSKHGVEVKTTTLGKVELKEYDFVMSNYAFSELKKKTQEEYLNKIIRNSKSGYFQINPDASECYQRNELIDIFSSFNKAFFFEDQPMSRRYPNNFTFTFGDR
jgi:hypothetical protein